MKFIKLGGGALALLVALCAPAPAQERYPSRLITIVVPLTPGTTIDILARAFGELLSRMGRQG